MDPHDIFKPQPGTDELKTFKYLGDVGPVIHTTLEKEFQV